MASAKLVLDGWRQARTAVFSAGMTPAAGDLMHEHPELWAADVFMMLAGMALEDLFKAVIITREPEVVTPNPVAPTRMLHGSIANHNLVFLAGRAGISLDPAEQVLLTRLSAFVQWSGRYPLAKTLQAMGADGRRTIEDPKDADSVNAAFDRARGIAWDAQLTEYAPQQEELERTKEQGTRAVVERWLEDNTMAELSDDGTLRYIARTTRDHSGGAIGCGGCHAQVNLDGTVRAATCHCGTLYFIDWVFQGGQDPSAHTWTFRPQNAVQ
jgi:hypothetical protein